MRIGIGEATPALVPTCHWWQKAEDTAQGPVCHITLNSIFSLPTTLLGQPGCNASGDLGLGAIGCITTNALAWLGTLGVILWSMEKK